MAIDARVEPFENRIRIKNFVILANNLVKTPGEDLSLIDGNYNDDNDGDHNDDDNEDDDEEDEEGNIGVAESDFRFADFEKRLINPRVVRACTIVLADWEKLPTRAIKSAVTILHRIAVGCKVPAMLFQASLFRIFQRTLNIPRDSRNEELCRLGIYIIRQFIKMAPENPKIFAELLFYKTLRESNDIEMGYDGPHKDIAKKGTWSEEQEDELRTLFMENQSNPSTDQDVIDWILENLIDKNRTRRGVMKKMKELGLIFKAPTKRSTANAKNARIRNDHEDMSELEKIIPTKKNQNSKTKKINKKMEPKKKAIVAKPLNIGGVKKLIDDLDGSLQEVLNWLEESIRDAIEDITDDEPSDDPDDGIPLVPFNSEQRDAMDNEQFCGLLKELGFQAPVEGMSTYWRIPVRFTADELTLRARIIAGEEMPQSIDENLDIVPIGSDNGSDEEIDSEAEIDQRIARASSLIYNHSDDEEDNQRPVQTPAKKQKKKKFDIFDMVKETDETIVENIESDNDNDEDADVTVTKRTTKSRHAILDSSDSEDEPVENISQLTSAVSAAIAAAAAEAAREANAIDITSENEKSKSDSLEIGSLVMEDDDDEENAADENQQNALNGNNKRERSESDESSLADEINVNKKKSRRAIIDDDDE